MSASATIFGNVGKDAEIRQHGERHKVSFTVAETTRVKKGTEWEDETCWHNCCVWVSSAQLPHLGDIRKGCRIALMGRPKSRKTDTGLWHEIETQFDSIVVGKSRSLNKEHDAREYRSDKERDRDEEIPF